MKNYLVSFSVRREKGGFKELKKNSKRKKTMPGRKNSRYFFTPTLKKYEASNSENEVTPGSLFSTSVVDLSIGK